MALLTTYTDANKVVDEPARTWTVVNGFRTSAYLVQYRIETTYQAEKYRYVGMTQATAMSCYAEFNDPAAGVNAAVRRRAGRMFDVEIEKLISETVEVSI